jgi:hypothetical protein
VRIWSMHPITLPRTATALALLACATLPCSPGFSESKPAEPVRQNPPRMQPANAETLTISFPGGPLSKLVASLNSDKNTKLSIIQSAGLDPVLPAFSVQEVRVDSVVFALGRLLEAQGYFLNPTGPNIAVLSKMETGHRPDFASLQLENKIGVRTAEDVISAIQQGCEFAYGDGKPSTLRFKYHPGTKLLFVAGTPPEVEIAHRVFASLPDNPKPPAPATDKK